MAFVFTACPGDPEDETTKKEDPNNPDPNKPTLPNPDAQDIVVKFGDASDKTQVVTVKSDDNDFGTVTYANDAFTYTYGINTSVTPNKIDGYGNVIARFEVNLGTSKLSDYGKVTMKWQATGYKEDSSVNRNKRLYLLAAGDPNSLVPYIDDAGIKSFIVSTNYFDTRYPANATAAGMTAEEFAEAYGSNPNDFYASKVDAPFVDGNDVQSVEFPIVAAKGNLTGKVWLSVYVHAEGDSFTISEFTLKAGAQAVEPTVPGNPAPDRPIPAGTLNAWFYLDLDPANNTTATSGAGAVLTTGRTYTDGVLTAAFGATTSGTRLIFDLKAAQVAALKDRTFDNAVVTIKGRTVTGTSTFRWSFADASAGSNWGASTIIGGSEAFDTLLKSEIAFPGQGSDPLNFIIQHRDDTAVTIEILSIRVDYVSATPGKLADNSFNEGRFVLPDFENGDVTAHNATVVVIDDTGFKVTTTEGYDWAWAYFKVTFPEGYKLSNYSKIDLKTTVFPSSADGDVGGYKPLFIAAYSDEADIPTTVGMPDADCIYRSGASSDFRDPDGNFVNRTLNLGTGLDTAAGRIADVDDNELWIAIRIHGGAGIIWGVSDINFY